MQIDQIVVGRAYAGKTGKPRVVERIDGGEVYYVRLGEESSEKGRTCWITTFASWATGALSLLSCTRDGALQVSDRYIKTEDVRPLGWGTDEELRVVLDRHASRGANGVSYSVPGMYGTAEDENFHASLLEFQSKIQAELDKLRSSFS